MELNKHSFPVKITLDEAILIFQKEFDKKGHKVKIIKDNIHLNITPYWVCFYDIDVKTDGKYQHISGQTALNSLTHKYEEDFLKLLDVYTPQVIDSIDVALEKVEIRVKKSLISLEEAREATQKMLSCKYSADKANISLSGFEEIYIPIWRCDIENQELYFDGVVGSINNFSQIVKKIKNNNELFSEMITEIKQPKLLLKYIAHFFIGIFKLIWYILKWIIKNWYIALIVALALAVVYFFIF